ncbi:hypothetical protein LNO81_19460 [Klebsiella variicola subsp. variicola]|nr:hypothetical protein [Klebsiella variicola subsp. variicola]
MYANPAFCRQTGYSLAQLLNQKPAPAGLAARRRARSIRRCGIPCSSVSPGAAS